MGRQQAMKMQRKSFFSVLWGPLVYRLSLCPPDGEIWVCKPLDPCLPPSRQNSHSKPGALRACVQHHKVFIHPPSALSSTCPHPGLAQWPPQKGHPGPISQQPCRPPGTAVLKCGPQLNSTSILGTCWTCKFSHAISDLIIRNSRAAAQHLCV